MQFIDMHCDTLMQLFLKQSEGMDLYQSKVTAVDFDRMKKSKQLAQFFAIFIPPKQVYEYFGMETVEDEQYIEILRKILMDNLEKYKDEIALARNAEEIEENSNAGKMSAILTMEDGKVVNGSLDKIKAFYDMGFRAISLTWNFPNCFGFPNSNKEDIIRQGLTEFGKTAVSYMQELGMLVDVSHLSDGGFYDVVNICKKPFVATHSNARELCGHSRNLTDEMIRLLGETGSVAGLNFGPDFLNTDPNDKKSTAKIIAAHARHMANVGGVECVAIGSDFDGIMGDLEVYDGTQMFRLEQELSKAGFTNSEIEHIFYKNVLRVIKESMR